VMELHRRVIVHASVVAGNAFSNEHSRTLSI
jgi:hypothetical protein